MSLITKSQLKAPALLLRQDRRVVITFEKIEPIAITAICLAMFLACAGLRVLNLSVVAEIRQFPDTKAYTEKAGWPLWSWGERAGPFQGTLAWWLQGRSPTVPFVFKMAGNDPHAIAFVQLGFSVLSWGALALLVSRAIEFSWLKPVAFLIILLFSLSDHIIMWDAMMLSDSISVSLMTLLIASWLWLLETWRWQKAALLLTVAFLWVFSRDTNAWVVLMLAALLFPMGILWRSPRYVWLGVVLVMFFIGNEISQNYSRRWATPFLNVVGQRILPNIEWTAYFAQLGMPVTPALVERSGKLAWDQNWAFHKDPALQEFRGWAHDRGKSSYLRFLLAHPIVTFQEPLQRIEVLLAPPLNSKRSFYWSNSFSPILTGLPAELIYFQRSTVFWIWASGLVSAFALAVALRTKEPKWLLALILIVLTYPHALLVWHGDPSDIERHALQASIHFRLGLWMLILFACDRRLVSTTHAAARMAVNEH